ncbi:MULTISPECIES: four-helix bundle copper-binding protein [Burkholderiaceae]|uniref:four-helix bundle copper-binding protein n=1 Tax=Burkholderiaceae TaxID=119060 RepID=UPI000B8BD06B|nr:MULTISPECIES: four-helix bundle copper-binding protein [Burkholderiaceae]OXS94238.1 four-helix bundle copper-binding protein [Pandoraea apista]RSK89253.1 four-helix bundle copper-binding protein [Pandoraea apista]
MPHEQFQSCIDACYSCATACDHCAISCLNEQDVKAMARCIKLDMDCAQICRLSASYMARDSEFARKMCKICADICEACGRECAKHQMDHCQHCAKACQKCADAGLQRTVCVSAGRAN